MKEKSKKPIICCPHRQWFRVGMFFSFAFIVVNPDTRHMAVVAFIFFVLYITRMPSLCVFEEGIQISAFNYKHFIEWNKIRVVRVTPQQFTITVDFPIPIYIPMWRKNYTATIQVLESKLGDKLKKISLSTSFLNK